MKVYLKKSKIIVFLILVLVFLTVVLNPVLSAEKKYLLAYSQCNMNAPWRVAQLNDMMYWVEKTGFDFIWTDGQNDSAKQLADCEDLISKKPDILVVSPKTSKALSPVVDMCNKANVPLLIVDRNIDAEIGGMYVGLITLDHEEYGTAGAKAIVKRLEMKYGEPKGNVLLLKGAIGASVTIDRDRGSDKVFSKYPNIKILDTASADFLYEKARKIMEDWLQKYPKGTVDVIYGEDGQTCEAIVDAVKNAGRDELYGYILGLGGKRTALHNLLDGYTFMEFPLVPYLGEMACKTAKKYLNGESFPKLQYYYKLTPLDTFTKEHRQKVQEYLDYLVANDLWY